MSRSSLASRLANKFRQAWQDVRFKASLRHLHGPSQLRSDPSAVIVMAQVRNGMYYLDSFFAHYRSLGIEHFVFFDNGSTDGTLERLRQEPGTIIDQSKLPLGIFEGHMRNHVAQTYGKDRWCLYVDMDEIFDFEGAKEIGIAGLARYLGENGYTALVAQMLEMFPQGPIREASDVPYKTALSMFDYYDISHLKRFDYHDPALPFSAMLAENQTSSSKLQFLWGGVRGKVFEETCCLTKHPLVFNGAGVRAGAHPHYSTGVRCAEISGVVKHYKFANDTLARDAAHLDHAAFMHGEDRSRLRVLAENPDVSLHSPDAQKWGGVEPLIEQGFVLSSDAYRNFIEDQRS